MRIRRRKMFSFGIMAGIIMLLLQGTILKTTDPVLLVILYLFIILLPLVFRKPKFSLGIIVGYVLGTIIFILMVVAAYKVMLYFTRI